MYLPLDILEFYNHSVDPVKARGETIQTMKNIYQSEHLFVTEMLLPVPLQKGTKKYKYQHFLKLSPSASKLLLHYHP